MEDFKLALVNAGLYRDEATAMLNTWKESYFEHAGLKVFWIAPHYFVEEILPITITPEPDELNRVIVGRSEVLTPEFEQLMMQYSEEGFVNAWWNDRFYLAYDQLRKEGIPDQWTSIDQDIITASEPVLIYPNPAQKEIHITCDCPKAGNILIRIINANGKEIY